MNDHEQMTLDPPGKIVVVGAGALGIEAALYGRYLGYDVHILEADTVGSWLLSLGDDPLPMLPDRCLSPLALSALQTQLEQSEHALPTTCRQWAEDGLIALTDSDLLSGRVTAPAPVKRISMVAIEPEQDDDPDELAEIPDDFRLHLADATSVDAEAVILATGGGSIETEFETPTDYLFSIGSRQRDDDESDLHRGLRQIVDLYAVLAGRSDLDLYRPRRS